MSPAAGGGPRAGAAPRPGRRPIRRAGGQATLEVLAAVPLVVLAILFAWQMAAVIGAGMDAAERARAAAIARLHAGGEPGLAVAGGRAAVPAVVPGAGRHAVTARAAVRLP